MAKAKKRTQLRSKSGKKLLAVRVVRPKKGQKKGQFKDIQTWERVSRQDQKSKSKAELEAAKKAAEDQDDE